jgi:DNA-directed RNA polymerase specialized sigma24 family protein
MTNQSFGVTSLTWCQAEERRPKLRVWSRFGRSTGTPRPYVRTPEVVAEHHTVIRAFYAKYRLFAFVTGADMRLDSEAITKRAFARLFAYWVDYRSNPEPHLLALVRREVLSAREQINPETSLVRTEELADVFGHVVPAGSSVWMALLHVDELPDRQREVLNALKVFGHSVIKTSELLNMKPGTVGPTFTAAKKNLFVKGLDDEDIDLLFKFFQHQMGGE